VGEALEEGKPEYLWFSKVKTEKIPYVLP